MLPKSHAFTIAQLGNEGKDVMEWIEGYRSFIFDVYDIWCYKRKYIPYKA